MMQYPNIPTMVCTCSFDVDYRDDDDDGFRQEQLLDRPRQPQPASAGLEFDEHVLAALNGDALLDHDFLCHIHSNSFFEAADGLDSTWPRPQPPGWPSQEGWQPL